MRFRPRAFTLLEVIVVVAIVALLATFSIPRLSGTERRAFEHAVEQVTDLLTMFAQRDSLSRRPIGLGLDVARRRFQLLVLEDAPNGEGSIWTRDTLVRPMVIPDAIDLDSIRVYIDGAPTQITDHPFGHSPGEQRPTLQIDLQTVSGEERTSIVLSPHAVAPHRIDGRNGAYELVPVDLDREGRSREDW